MKQNKKRRSRKGFTLIELIVVIAILAILAAIAIPAFNNQLSNAKEKTHQANAKILQSAAQVAIAQGDILFANGETWTGLASEEWVDYIAEWPVNPYTKMGDDGAGYVVTFTVADDNVTVVVTNTANALT